MENEKISAEELEKVTGGSNAASDPREALRIAIEQNLVAGAGFLALELTKQGRAADVKSILDSFPVHNEAWNAAFNFYFTNQ